MPRRLIANSFVVVLLGAISVAQTPIATNSNEPISSSPSHVTANETGWDSLKQLGLHHEARVVLTDATAYQGALISVSDDVLVIHSGSSDQTFARDRVQRVSIRRPGHRGRNTLIGLGIGAGAGLGLGIAADRCSPRDLICFGNRGKAIGTPVFGLVGAGIGALIPTSGWREVYRLR